MIQLGNKSIDSIYLGNKVVTEAYIGSNKIWPEGISYEDAVAILTSEDGTITQYFESCADAATYATNNSDTNWNLTINSGDIPNSCFIDLTNLISLTLGDSVTSIGASAFNNCTGFTGSLTIPDSVTSIGNTAFYNCYGFTGDLVIPSDIAGISAGVFRDCYGFNGSLTIPDNIEGIGAYAFYGCYGFTGALTIPSSVTSISALAFSQCTSFDDDLSYYGKTNPSTNTTAFNSTPFTVCKVPIDYEDDTFCGLPVSKELVTE